MVKRVKLSLELGPKWPRNSPLEGVQVATFPPSIDIAGEYRLARQNYFSRAKHNEKFFVVSLDLFEKFER